MPPEITAVDFFVSKYPSFAPKRNDGQLEIILGNAEGMDAQPNQTLYKQGDAVANVYLLVSGTVQERQQVRDPRTGPRMVSRSRNPGRLLGLYDLIYRRPHSTTATVTDDSVLYALKPQQIFRLLYNYPELRQSLIPIQILNRLRTIPFFSEMTPTILGFLAESCIPISIPGGTSIYSNNDSAEYIYVVDKGQVRLKYPDGQQLWLGNSQPFGYVGTAANLLHLPDPYDVDHAADSGCATSLFGWFRSEFVEITGQSPERLGQKVRAEAGETLDSLSIFNDFSDAERFRLLGYMSHYHFPHHQLLTQQGEFADSLWILMPRQEAKMYAFVGNSLQKSSVTGTAFFNENALEAQVPCTSTLQAEPGSQWLRLHTEDFRKFLAGEPDKMLIGRLGVHSVTATVLAKAAPTFDFPLLPGESVELLERRHWIVFLKKILLPLILFGIIVFGWGGITLTGVATLFVDLPVLALLLLSGLWMLWGWVDYYNDYFLVTNMRVAQVEKVIFFSEKRVTALLEQVRDVRFQQSTLWQTFWRYGTLSVHTAGKSQISFDFLHNPDQAAAKINQLSMRRAEHHVAGGKREIYNALERQLGLTIDTPPRVWQQAQSKAAQAQRSWWRFLFNRESREQFLTEQHSDRVVWRKHWFVLLTKIAAPAILSLTSTAATVWMMGYYIAGAPLSIALLAIPVGLFSMFLWTWLWWVVQDWYNDTYEVTDTEIIDTEMRPLLFPIYFDKMVRRASLIDINDISYTVPDPVSYLLNMGNVVAETAAQAGKFSFDRVKNPLAVSDEIRRRVEQYYERQRSAENRRRAQEFPVWFEMYERLGTEREGEQF